MSSASVDPVDLEGTASGVTDDSAAPSLPPRPSKGKSGSKLRKMPLPKSRPDVLFSESNAAAVAAGTDVDPDLDPDPEVQAALAEFCKVGNDELSEAEKYAIFSGFDLDVNEVHRMDTLYPLSDTSCRQVFAPSLPFLLPHHSQKRNIIGLA